MKIKEKQKLMNEKRIKIKELLNENKRRERIDEGKRERKY